MKIITGAVERVLFNRKGRKGTMQRTQSIKFQCFDFANFAHDLPAEAERRRA